MQPGGAGGPDVELLRRNGYREDAYVRPSVYKSTEAIGVRLHDLEHDFRSLPVPFGDYIDTTVGISTHARSSWRRTATCPSRRAPRSSAPTSTRAFSKTEAMLNGYDEAIVLTADGHVSEGSAENLFMVRDGSLVTPPRRPTTSSRASRAPRIMELARSELGLETSCAPSTAASSTSPTRSSCAAPARRSRRSPRIDHRPVGDGRHRARHRAHQGHLLRRRARPAAGLRDWLTPVYWSRSVRAPDRAARRLGCRVMTITSAVDASGSFV